MKNLCVIAILALILASCQESLEDRCEREAKEYTAKQCPIRIDKTTRMDSLTFERETHTIHYYYTLMGNADSEVVLKNIDAVGALKNELKNTTTMKVYKDNKYRFAYTYHSEKDPQKEWRGLCFIRASCLCKPSGHHRSPPVSQSSCRWSHAPLE